ncbi:hypothetical protein F9U42_12345 [Pectobacterium versatile]|uniref:O-antigen ligase family protein n=1 Tax=Pectobacterium versatile TaxID=2488639 RepID=UPI001B3869F7|nr:O-antigen ligase family protein [Pectobacterium versatile]MBQ4767923.1 hypothetical protein [Pectobacterium versatile]
MNINLKKMLFWNSKEFFFFYFLFVLLIFDMINGFLVTNNLIATAGISSPSQIGRLLAIVISVFFLWRVKSNLSWLFFSLYILALEAICGLFFSLELSSVIYGFINSYKLIYLALVTVVFLKLIKTQGDLGYFLLLFKWHLYIVGGSLFFSIITGIGADTYDGGGLGTKGFFASGNSLGLYLGLSTIFLIIIRRYYIGSYIKLSWLGVFFLISSTVLVGTKTAVILAFLSLFQLFYNTKLKWVLFATFSTFCIYFLNEISEQFQNAFTVLVFRYNNAPNIIYFLGSGRIDYVFDAFDVLYSQDSFFVRLIFGGGSFLSYQNPIDIEAFDTLETDFFDVLFMYGFVGLFIYLVLFFYMMKKSFSEKKIFLIVILLFGHSAIAGHVLFNGMSGFLISVLFIIVSKIHFLNEKSGS